MLSTVLPLDERITTVHRAKLAYICAPVIAGAGSSSPGEY